MRYLPLVAALLGLSGFAGAGYLVDFGTGDRMAVDAYREEGARVHLRRGAEEISVPRARVRSVFDESATHPIADERSPSRPDVR